MWGPILFVVAVAVITLLVAGLAKAAGRERPTPPTSPRPLPRFGGGRR